MLGMKEGRFEGSREVCEIKMKDVWNSEGRWEGRGFIGKEVHLEAVGKEATVKKCENC